MEIIKQLHTSIISIMFKIDLIVWKQYMVPFTVENKVMFKIDLIVWKYDIVTPEQLKNKFKIDLIVWK